MRLWFAGVETGLAAIDQHLSAFHAVYAARSGEMALVLGRGAAPAVSPGLAVLGRKELLRLPIGVEGGASADEDFFEG